jgi:hypothetical protein
MTVSTGGEARGGGRQQQRLAQVVAYFYQPDGTTEMSPAPTDVTVKAGTGDKSPVLSLSPDAKTGDPKSAGRFASKPDSIREGFEGALKAKINGEPVEASFLIR